MNRKPLISGTSRGITLIEALVALVVVSVGMLALMQVQVQMRMNADVSRQRAEAVRLAQAEMERFRAFSVLESTVGKQDYADITALGATTLTGQENVNTTFTIERAMTASTTPAYKALSVTVRWSGRSGDPYSVTVDSAISRSDPALGAQLTVPATSSTVRNPMNRNIRIPVTAVDLGNNRSGFTPPGQSSGYYVLNNADATVIQYCTGALTASDYANAQGNGGCQARYGYTLAGFINFDLRNNISAVSPGSTVCDFYQSLQSSNLIAATNPTLDINSVVLDRASMKPDAAAAPLPREYFVNLVTVAPTGTVFDGATNVSLTGDLTIELSSGVSGANRARFYDTQDIVLRVKGGSEVERFRPTSGAGGQNVRRSISNSTFKALSDTGLTLTLDPTANLVTDTVYELVIPANMVRAYKHPDTTTYDTNSSTITVTFTTGSGPTLSTTSPAANAQVANLSDNITMTFNRNVVAAASSAYKVLLYKKRSNGNQYDPVESFTPSLGTGDSGGSISFGGNTVTINPFADLVTGATYAVQVNYGAIRDSNGFPFAGITDTSTFYFSTTSATVIAGCPGSSGLVLNYMEVRTSTAGGSTGAGVAVDGGIAYNVDSSSGAASAICYSDAASSVAVQSTKTIGYFCVIYSSSNVPFTWSGKINLWGPTGWLSSNRQYTVCRYHDYNNDSVDTNIEHPAVYSTVNSSITDQNFLVIKSNRTCTDETFGVGSPTNVTIYYNTQQYQP